MDGDVFLSDGRTKEMVAVIFALLLYVQDEWMSRSQRTATKLRLCDGFKKIDD